MINTPINQGLLQSDLNANSKNIIGANLSTYAGAGLAWNVVTSKFDVTGGVVSTGYSIIDTTVSGQNVRIIIPDVRVSGTAVVYCHGLGETVTVGSYFDPLASDKTRYMLDALQAGYLLAAGDFHGFQWDNATAQADIEAMVAYLVSNFGVNNIVLWSQSAGGPLGLLKATQGFAGAAVQGWFGIFPGVNLDAAHSNAALTSSINTAFPGYPTGTTGRDPILFAASAYNGLRLRVCQSPADTVLPKAIHGDALATLTAGHAIENTVIATTGDHGDASNFTQARADDFLNFLNRCF